jgi:hypothetical protein
MFCGFPQFIQANSGIVAQIKPRPFPSTSILVHYSGIFLRLEAVHTVRGEKVNILGGHSIGYSKQKIIYVYVSYSERFPR